MDNRVSTNIMEKSVQRDSAGASWLILAFSGLALIPILGLHMIAHHFIVEGGLRTFQDVIDYISNPVVFALEVIFLIVVTPHAMLGLYGIIIDLGPSHRVKTGIVWIFKVITVIVIGYGIWLAIALQGL